MNNKIKLQELEDNNLWKIFIKNESSPLHMKENNRSYRKLCKLKADNPNNEEAYKMAKGKLLEGDESLDEFNIIN